VARPGQQIHGKQLLLQSGLKLVNVLWRRLLLLLLLLLHRLWRQTLCQLLVAGPD
jgi:hypothetical protein